MVIMKIRPGNKTLATIRTSFTTCKTDEYVKLCTDPPYNGKKFDGLQGKWYPECASTVSRILREIHRYNVIKCGPVIAGPMTVANPRKRISAG